MHWSLLKTCADVFGPVIANQSIQTGQFPFRYKQVQVLRLLKKDGLNSALPANYRPISNLSTISKVLERLVLTRLRPRLLVTQFQSVQVRIQEGAHHRDRAATGVEWRLHGCRQQES